MNVPKKHFRKKPVRRLKPSQAIAPICITCIKTCKMVRAKKWLATRNITCDNYRGEWI